jgi:D-glycero-D-manno-heptose 1,7-bisphosphate phosphatase|nr:HAD family hydrolase [Candidatus Krumholzibacteria bacterium]
MSIWKKPATSPGSRVQPALFLDRDGVVIDDADYLADPEGVRILPGVPEALARARAAGFLLIGVSNQSGIGRGYFTEDDFHQVMTRLDAALAARGVAFDSFHYCPHAPDQDCLCRKPLRGMLNEARKLFSLDLARSWMVGDKASDIAFGRQGGLGAVLVRTGHGLAEEIRVIDQFDDDPRVGVADDLPAAVAWILKRQGSDQA